MSTPTVKVENGAVRIALGRFGGSLRQRDALLKAIAAGMLVSVRRTFREQGSPADTWAPLAESTLRNSRSKASSGRKILILSGRLLNSIQAQPTSSGIVVGTNLVYARVQQEGSADRAGAAIGPQARIAGRASLVAAHKRNFLREVHYTTREAVGRDGRTYNVPTPLRSVDEVKRFKNGKERIITRPLYGPRQQMEVGVSQHQRFANIPPRPYLVFRPEDPARIRGQVIEFVNRAALQAGLNAQGAH